MTESRAYILEAGCAERGCACYDVRVDKGVEIKTMRELTDEEIDHTWFNHGWGSVEKDDLMKFARAILRKASERA